jgi:hypothetical protein
MESTPGAFFMVEADDIDQAIAMASPHPGADLGQYLTRSDPVDFGRRRSTYEQKLISEENNRCA